MSQYFFILALSKPSAFKVLKVLFGGHGLILERLAVIRGTHVGDSLVVVGAGVNSPTIIE